MAKGTGVAGVAGVAGVRKAPPVLYVTSRDVMYLIGCKESKAYEIIRNVNKKAEDNGEFAFKQGKANKYTFSKLFGIPIEDVNQVIEWGQGVHDGVL